MTHWIEWRGGECPLPADCQVLVHLDGGAMEYEAIVQGAAGEYDWKNGNSRLGHDKIIAYIPLRPELTTFAEAERRLLFATLYHFNGNKPKAAESLGVSLKTIYNRIAHYRSK
jgi:DNA-binding NtrC family response regulator